MSRRSAYRAQLPAAEHAMLARLSGADFHARIHALYAAGWTLRAIGEACSPARARSTVRSWLAVAPDESALEHAQATIPPPPPPRATGRATRPSEPPIPAATAAQIARLAPIARRYRARSAAGSAAARANAELTTICLALHAQGVSIRSLAGAASVTYRAMANRLGR